MNAASPEPSAPAVLIAAEGLGVLRGDLVLFRNVSLSLQSGDALVLRGPNGAGKTTLLRVLAGLTRAEAGAVRRHAAFHWLGHRDGLKPQETPESHLALWARAWGAGADIPALLSRMGLLRAREVPARYLSAGQRRRAALARLLLEARPIWMLDEPYTALDAEGRDALEAMISAHRANGGAVIAAIHGEAGFAPSAEINL